jgi:hypothetical protein
MPFRFDVGLQITTGKFLAGCHDAMLWSVIQRRA